MGPMDIQGQWNTIPVFEREHEGLQRPAGLPQPLVAGGVEQHLVFRQDRTKQAQDVLDPCRTESERRVRFRMGI